MAKLTVEQALNKAITHHNRGERDQAISLYLAILNAAPNHVAALHYLGVARFETGARQEGLLAVGAARQMAPNDVDCLSNLTAMHLAVGQQDEALSVIRGALARQSRSARLWRRYAEVLGSLAEREGQIAALKQAQALAPENQDIAKDLAAAEATATA